MPGWIVGITNTSGIVVTIAGDTRYSVVLDKWIVTVLCGKGEC